MGAFVTVALVAIVLHHANSGFKNISFARVGLMSLFLAMVAMFVGGQTAALTFTSVSRACMARNMVLTAGDQFAHIAGTIVGMSLIMRTPSRISTFGLLGWTVVRFGMLYYRGIVDRRYRHRRGCSSATGNGSHLLAKVRYYSCGSGNDC